MPGSHAFDTILSTDGLNDVSESNLNSTASNIGAPVTPVRYTGVGRHRSGDGKKIELVETVADLDSGIFEIEEKVASLPEVEGQQRKLVRLGETNGEDGHGQAVEGAILLSFPNNPERKEESREADNTLQAVERNLYSSNGQSNGPDRNVDDKKTSEPQQVLVGNNELKNTEDDQSCPVYQQYTMEDLNPWVQRGGISLANLETARGLATFRVQIVNESVYVHEWAVSRLAFRDSFRINGGNLVMQKSLCQEKGFFFFLLCDTAAVHIKVILWSGRSVRHEATCCNDNTDRLQS